MVAQRLDGKACAASVEEELHARISNLKKAGKSVSPCRTLASVKTCTFVAETVWTTMWKSVAKLSFKP